MTSEEKVKRVYPTAHVKHQRAMGATWYAVFASDHHVRPTWDLGARWPSRAWVLAWNAIQEEAQRTNREEGQ